MGFHKPGEIRAAFAKVRVLAPRGRGEIRATSTYETKKAGRNKGDFGREQIFRARTPGEIRATFALGRVLAPKGREK